MNSRSLVSDRLCEVDTRLVSAWRELDLPGVVPPPLLTPGEMEGDRVARGDSEGVSEGLMAAEVRLDS